MNPNLHPNFRLYLPPTSSPMPLEVAPGLWS